MAKKIAKCSLCREEPIRYIADQLCQNCYQTKLRWSKRSGPDVARRIAKLALYSARMELISNVTNIKMPRRRRKAA